jgi:hypothetical protein
VHPEFAVFEGVLQIPGQSDPALNPDRGIAVELDRIEEGRQFRFVQRNARLPKSTDS